MGISLVDWNQWQMKLQHTVQHSKTNGFACILVESIRFNLFLFLSPHLVVDYSFDLIVLGDFWHHVEDMLFFFACASSTAVIIKCHFMMLVDYNYKETMFNTMNVIIGSTQMKKHVIHIPWGRLSFHFFLFLKNKKNLQTNSGKNVYTELRARQFERKD